MVESIEWLRAFIFHYPSLEYIVILLGAGFGGELALFILGFLAAQNVISVSSLIIFSFLGTFFSDTIWFLLGRTAIVKNVIAHRYAHTTISIINETMQRVSKSNHLIALIIAKFLIGTRVLLIMYIGAKNIQFQKFIRYNALAIFLWLVVIIPIGFLSGFGFAYLAEIWENLYVAIGFILLIVVLLIVFEIWLKNRLAWMNQ